MAQVCLFTGDQGEAVTSCKCCSVNKKIFSYVDKKKKVLKRFRQDRWDRKGKEGK